MAGRGPRPKPPERRVRRDDSGITGTVLPFRPVAAPDLPDKYAWNPLTVEWWQMWRDSPLSLGFTATDWSFLRDTALLYDKLWSEGDISVMAELRLRVAKFGATPEDRARLRITFADADTAENRRNTSSARTAPDRYATVRRLGG